jgi:hypothetical protein
MPHQAMLKRIRAEYLELPGLRLTLDQARRLCGVELGLCQTVLDGLVYEKFLCVRANGAYARVTDGADSSRPQSAKAFLRAERRAEAS